MIIITGDEVHNPDAVSKESTTRPSGNVVHEIPGSDEVVVVLRPSGPRRGTRTVTFEDEDAALACADDLSGARIFTYADTDHPEHDVTFILTAGPDLAVDEDVREPWSVTFGYLVIEDESVGS